MIVDEKTKRLLYASYLLRMFVARGNMYVVNNADESLERDHRFKQLYNDMNDFMDPYYHYGIIQELAIHSVSEIIHFCSDLEEIISLMNKTTKGNTGNNSYPLLKEEYFLNLFRDLNDETKYFELDPTVAGDITVLLAGSFEHAPKVKVQEKEIEKKSKSTAEAVKEFFIKEIFGVPISIGKSIGGFTPDLHGDESAFAEGLSNFFKDYTKYIDDPNAIYKTIYDEQNRKIENEPEKIKNLRILDSINGQVKNYQYTNKKRNYYHQHEVYDNNENRIISEEERLKIIKTETELQKISQQNQKKAEKEFNNLINDLLDKVLKAFYQNISDGNTNAINFLELAAGSGIFTYYCLNNDFPIAIPISIPISLKDKGKMKLKFKLHLNNNHGVVSYKNFTYKVDMNLKNKVNLSFDGGFPYDEDKDKYSFNLGLGLKTKINDDVTFFMKGSMKAPLYKPQWSDIEGQAQFGAQIKFDIPGTK